MFAAYYVWYSTGSGPHGNWSGWGKSDRTTEISSAAYPLIGPYDSDDPEVVRWHIRLAKASGLSGFFVSSWGPGNWQKLPGLTEQAFEVVLRVAAEEKFHVALMDETAQFHGNFADVKRWAAAYLAKYKDSPAYLKIDGRPVYYVYQVSFDPKLTVQGFEELKKHVEQKVGPVYWLVDKISNAGDRLHIPGEWLGATGADGYACYGTFSNFREWRYEDLIGRYRAVVTEAHAAGLKMMLPVHPGHDNSRSRKEDVFIMPREDGRTLRGYLRAVRESGADYVLVTSWNEWPETTVIEPAATWADPYQYLKIIAEVNGVNFEKPAEPGRARGVRAREE